MGGTGRTVKGSVCLRFLSVNIFFPICYDISLISAGHWYVAGALTSGGAGADHGPRSQEILVQAPEELWFPHQISERFGTYDL